jgi:hypothetical protein
MLRRYARILDACEPYLVATRRYRDLMSLAPLGVRIPESNVFNPHDLASAELLSLVQRMDDLVNQPVGMKMDRWVFYDCAEMPGAIFGFGVQAAKAPGWLRTAMGVKDDYTGLIPLSNLIVIPMLPPGAFLSYSLCSVNQVCPGGAPEGLELVTLLLGLKVLGVRDFYSTTQWRAPTLQVYTQLGPLELLTAYTPAHSLPATLTFRFPVDDVRIAQALLGTPALAVNTVLLDADDTGAMRRLQGELEEGARYDVVGRPIVSGALTLVPLARAPEEAP